MKMTSQLYQYSIILFALASTSFVLASDGSIDNKNDQVAMPPAPSGPYRSNSESAIGKQTDVQAKLQQQVPQSAQPMQAPNFILPPQQQMRPPMPPPNWNQNIQQPPQWAQGRPQQQMRPPMPPPNWNQNIPPPQWAQRRPQQQMRPPMPPPNRNQNIRQPPRWAQPEIPDWVKNPPHGPKPPAWVNNRHRQAMQPPEVPDWVKNPPYGPKPPAWVVNPPQANAYQYGNPGRN